jgi:hypothetical protein
VVARQSQLFSAPELTYGCGFVLLDVRCCTIALFSFQSELAFCGVSSTTQPTICATQYRYFAKGRRHNEPAKGNPQKDVSGQKAAVEQHVRLPLPLSLKICGVKLINTHNYNETTMIGARGRRRSIVPPLEKTSHAHHFVHVAASFP